MSREAALDLRQIIQERYDAVVAIDLQRSHPFRWPTNCAFPDPHNTLVHRQSERAAVLARPPRSAFLIRRSRRRGDELSAADAGGVSARGGATASDPMKDPVTRDWQ